MITNDHLKTPVAKNILIFFPPVLTRVNFAFLKHDKK